MFPVSFPPESPSPLTQPDCARLQPQIKRPCIEAHRLASECDSNIEPLRKRPRTFAPLEYTHRTNHLQHLTAALPFIHHPALKNATAPTPPSGMDVDQHDADLDEPTTPLAADQDTQLAADDSPLLVACQGQGAAQEERMKEKPKNWAKMDRTQQRRWFRRKQG